MARLDGRKGEREERRKKEREKISEYEEHVLFVSNQIYY